MTTQPATAAPDPSTAPGPARAVDASMDLLNQILRHPVDPDYALVAARDPSRGSLRWPLAVVAVLIGAMFAVSAVQTTRTAPAVSVERIELISRIQAAEAGQDQLRARTSALTAEIATLRAAALGTDDQAQTLAAQINNLDPVVGNVAVTGPGLEIIVDDAPEANGEASTDGRQRVLDIDLQALANGLWSAGAEAVAINGHRLTNLTAIRGAGDAITVDYRSLTRPYRVQAIGNAKTLPADFAESAGGAWWNELALNRGMRFEMRSEQQLTLPNDPGLGLRYAQRSEP